MLILTKLSIRRSRFTTVQRLHRAIITSTIIQGSGGSFDPLRAATVLLGASWRAAISGEAELRYDGRLECASKFLCFRE